MIIKSAMTDADRLKKKIRSLKGKDTKSKAKEILNVHLNLLKKISELKRYPQSLKESLDRVQEELRDGLLTTSSDDKLKDLVKASEDLEQLLDDMMHAQAESTYERRLSHLLVYLKDFQSQKYSPSVSFYDETSDKLEDQLKSVAKDIHYRVAKMQYQRKSIIEDITYKEKENIKNAKALQNMDRNRAEFKAVAKEIEDGHSRITFNQGSLDLLRKTISSYQMLADLLEQLSLLDQYNKHLKGDGYIRRLVKRLYRNPDQLEILEDTTDLVDVLAQIKEEILHVESIIKPSQSMVFKDSKEEVDEDLIKHYMDMEA